MTESGNIGLIDRLQVLPYETEWHVDEALVPKLPDRLTDRQKQRKVHNLLQELRRSGSIVNQGTRSHPEWVIAEAPRD